jgi:hypothetical protein
LKFEPFFDDFGQSNTPVDLAEVFKSASFERVYGRYTNASHKFQALLQQSLGNRARLAIYLEDVESYFDRGYFATVVKVCNNGLQEAQTMVLCQETVYQTFCLRLELLRIQLKISRMPPLDIASQLSAAEEIVKPAYSSAYSPVKVCISHSSISVC